MDSPHYKSVYQGEKFNDKESNNENQLKTKSDEDTRFLSTSLSWTSSLCDMTTIGSKATDNSLLSINISNE